MDLSRRPRCRSLAVLVSSALLFLALSLAGGMPALAQAPASCPADGICNDMTYALCIAASCNPEDFMCGVTVTPGGWIPCDQEGLDTGNCGPCYIFTGQSCSYKEPCSELEEGVLYSTYSEALLEDYGFLWVANSDSAGMDCMDGVCTATGQSVTVNGTEIQTATCQCKEAGTGGFMQINNCSGNYSSHVWSTAGLACSSDAECCSGTCTNGSCT